MSKGVTSYVSAKRAVETEKTERRAGRIRTLFKQTGAIAPRAFVKRCREAGIFTDSDVDAAAEASFQKVIRDALSADDERGLPFAGPTTITDIDGHTEWAQRELWRYADYEINVSERVSQRDGEHIRAVKLADECLLRHGQRPQISALPSLRTIRADH